MPSFLGPLIRNPAGCTIRNLRTGHVIADRVLTAFDSASRRTGLLKRDSFPSGEALVIAPCGAVHTFFMRFPIDILFVGRDGSVLKTREAVGPRRIAASLRAFATIELPSGTIARTGTRRGDSLTIEVATEPRT